MTATKEKKPKKVLPPYEDFIIRPCFEKYNLHFGRELQFDDGCRQWRFDFYCFDVLLAIEINGLGGKSSRHMTTKGYIDDMEKINRAMILGWSVLQFTPAQIRDMSYQQTLSSWLYYRREYENQFHVRRMQGMKSFKFTT